MPAPQLAPRVTPSSPTALNIQKWMLHILTSLVSVSHKLAIFQTFHLSYWQWILLVVLAKISEIILSLTTHNQSICKSCWVCVLMKYTFHPQSSYLLSMMLPPSPTPPSPPDLGWWNSTPHIYSKHSGKSDLFKTCISRVHWHMPRVQATGEAEPGGSVKPRSSGQA